MEKYLLPVALALLTVGLAWPPQAPSLHTGSQKYLDFEPGTSKQNLPFRLETDEVLHLRIQQAGLDLEIQVLGEDGRGLLPIVDLPFGAEVTEELRIVAPKAEKITLEIEVIEGRGRPKVEILKLGPATAEEQVLAAEDAALWTGYHAPLGEARILLGRLKEQGSSQGRRALAAGILGIRELGYDDSAACTNFGLALQAPLEPALRIQLLSLKGRAHSRLEEIEEARSTWLEARELALSNQDFTGAGLVEVDLGALGWRTNDIPMTLHHYSAARGHYTAAGNEEAAARQDLKVARTLVRLGNSPEGPARLLRGLARASTLDSQAATISPARREYRAELLREIGWWLHLEGRSADARPLLEQAAQLDPHPIDSLQRLASMVLDLGDAAAARRFSQLALDFGPNADERLYLEIVLCGADLEENLLDSARNRCSWALEQPAAVSLKGSLPAIYDLLARIEWEDGHLLEAEAYAQKACAAVEAQRQSIDDAEERMEFLAVRTKAHEHLTELRIALHTRFPRDGWDLRALEAADRGRARRLLDLLQKEPGNKSPARDINRRQEVHNRLTIAVRGPLNHLLHQGELHSGDVKLLEPLLEQLDDLRAAADASTADPATPMALSPESFVTPPDILHLLESDTALLFYFLGPKDAYGWVLHNQGWRLVSLGSTKTLKRYSRAVQELLVSSDPLASSAYDEWAGRLSGLLLEKFAPELGSAKRIVVVAPAELQGLPFAALPFPLRGNQPLIASRSLIFLPSASILPALRNRPRPISATSGQLAIIDDPVYDNDPRLPAAVRRAGPFRPLPDTANEAEALLGLFEGPEGSTLRLTGFAANRQRLLEGALTGFRFIHFATHARTDVAPGGLILSQYDEHGRRVEEKFGFAELTTLSLQAELVVTSACSSALGESVPGEGLLGLSQGFLSAGAPRLLLTHWPVHGEGARALMIHFYRHLLAGAAPPEALRQAQLLRRSEGASTSEWAGFAFHGDWRAFSDALDQHRAPARVLKVKNGENPQSERSPR